MAVTVTRGGKAYASGTGTAFGFTPDDNGSYRIVLTVSDGPDPSVSGTEGIPPEAA